jgi:NAD(P)-dependent dehydrogenase (short-subunit alcohol dehydrogenase family)
VSAHVRERKAVLVTGASSGIGELTAGELVRRGFHVFAGVRAAADATRLAALGPRCTPLRLDVTDAESIAAAAAAMSARGLYGLVNTAGVVVAAPLEYLPIDELRHQFEVNVIGALAMTQAVLPLLRRSLGRVINVGSIAGRMALPFAGPYAASKGALDLLTQSLRMELAPFDVGVAYIEPGSHRTPIWARSRSAADAALDRLPPLGRARYGAPLAALRAIMTAAEQRGGDPQRVARIIADALQTHHLRGRYTIGADTRARMLFGAIPQAVRERAMARRLNAGRA